MSALSPKAAAGLEWGLEAAFYPKRTPTISFLSASMGQELIITKVNSLKWNEIAELVGLAAILSGIFFVYAEIKQNGTIAQAELNFANRANLDDISTRVLDPEFSALYLKGIHNPAELNETERQSLNAHFESLLAVLSFEYHSTRLGIFREYEILPRQIAREYFAVGYGRAFWNVRMRTYIPQVVTIVEDELSKLDSAPPSSRDHEILEEIVRQ